MLCLLILFSLDDVYDMFGSLRSSSLILHPANAEFVDPMSTPSAKLAWNNIIKAESSGAEVSELISRFEVAADLARQGKDLDFHSCDSSAHCDERANTMFISIASDAIVLEAHSEQAAEQQTLIAAISSALVAIPIAFFCLYVYKKRESYKLEQFYKMEIEFKEDA